MNIILFWQIYHNSVITPNTGKFPLVPIQHSPDNMYFCKILISLDD